MTDVSNGPKDRYYMEVLKVAYQTDSPYVRPWAIVSCYSLLGNLGPVVVDFSTVRLRYVIPDDTELFLNSG